MVKAVAPVDCGEKFELPVGRDNEVPMVAGWIRSAQKPVVRPRDMFTPNLHIDELKVKNRNFIEIQHYMRIVGSDIFKFYDCGSWSQVVGLAADP